MPVCAEQMSAVELSVFASRIEAICDEMGAVLQRSAFSTNIKDRLDYSCAVFDHEGRLCAQAAHIPVHLGSMAYAMRGLVTATQWRPGDMLIVNDPYLGGTHLPDVTLIAAVFNDEALVGFVVNRAHHADIGAEAPGSMPLSSSLEEEGVLIPPTLIIAGDQLQQTVYQRILGAIDTGQQAQGDFAAQISANRTGVHRLRQLVGSMGNASYARYLTALNEYAERLAVAALEQIPDGQYRFEDCLDDDGLGNRDLPIVVTITVNAADLEVDFTGTAKQVQGNVNCPLSVAAAAVYYVFRCLMPSHTPNCDGALRRIKLFAPQGCLLNAERPAAVAAGNVETSSRVVDALLGALAVALPDKIPAASQGSMNNLAMGAEADSQLGTAAWSYYETIGGGMGAGPKQPGLHAVQTHMTNTRNTPVEVLEMSYPVRMVEYAIRKGSGGPGKHRGGDGIVREFEFLQNARITLLSERRLHAPWGLHGGGNGAAGKNRLNGRSLPGKISLQVKPGDRLRIETPGGGGYGQGE